MIKSSKYDNNELTRHTSNNDEKMMNGYTNGYGLNVFYEELLKVSMIEIS